MIDLYINIKKRREELDLTQTQLAEACGYADKTMISKIEKGLVDLPQSKIAVIAKALNTTPRSLMGWDDDPVAAEIAEEMQFNSQLEELTRKMSPERRESLLQYARFLLSNSKGNSTP